MQNPTTRTRMTAEEFIALPERDLPTELIDGELVMRGSPTTKHQRMSRKIVAVLMRWTTSGEIFYAPYSVMLDNANFYQPDVLWVSEENLSIIADDGINGAPDLVVEVLSPGTAKADYGVKFQTYERYGVREYWIADPDEGFILVWQRNANGRFVQHGAFGAGETLSSPLLGQSVNMSEVLP